MSAPTHDLSSTIAVVMVTYNVRELAREALRSLQEDAAASQLALRIAVVDNASSDGTVAALVAEFPQITFIANSANAGYAAANNQGLHALGYLNEENPTATDLPAAVYLLNPDTITQPGATAALLTALSAAAAVGLVGARLRYGDGRHQHSAFRFPGLRQLWAEFGWLPGRLREGRTNGRYPLSKYESEQPFAVDFVLGAAMMARREAVQQVSGLDESYVMYCEEIDWAWRMRRAGWQVRCAPAATITHLSGQSSAQRPAASALQLWRSRLRLYDRIHPRWKRKLARALIARGMRRRLHQLHPRAETERALADSYREVIALARAGST